MKVSEIMTTAATALGGGGIVALVGYLGVRRQAAAAESKAARAVEAARVTAEAAVAAAQATAEPAVIEQVRQMMHETREDARAASAEAEAARVDAAEARRLVGECERHREVDNARCAEEIEGIRAEVTLLAQRAIKAGAWSGTGLHDIERLAKRKTPSRPVLAQTPGLRLPEPGEEDDRG